jgi:hypothetical protein
MRVQVYEEELGEGVEIVEQTSREGKRFYGLRVWLKSPQELLDHSTAGDDDRSAVTFWAADRERLLILNSQISDALFPEQEPAP